MGVQSISFLVAAVLKLGAMATVSSIREGTSSYTYAPCPVSPSISGNNTFKGRSSSSNTIEPLAPASSSQYHSSGLASGQVSPSNQPTGIRVGQVPAVIAAKDESGIAVELDEGRAPASWPAAIGSSTTSRTAATSAASPLASAALPTTAPRILADPAASINQLSAEHVDCIDHFPDVLADCVNLLADPVTSIVNFPAEIAG